MATINGFLFSSSTSRIGIKTYKVPGTGVSLPVRSDVAPLLIGFATEFHQKVEALHIGWCWGYAYRAVRGSSSPSFHGAGLAIDLNAPAHPLGKAGTYNAKQRATINALCKKYGLRAGMNYSGRKDEMHFEVILPKSQALALVKRLQAAKTKAPAAASSRAYPGYVLAEVRLNSPAVVAVQNALGIKPADGDFGPKTTAAVKAYQKRHGLTADGKVGPVTWGVIF